MADFYVNVATGDDANPGTAERPVRSITQALILASSSADELGTVFIAAGTYEPPNENFPLLVRPGYSLQGAGRETTLIRFTGEARTVAGDPTRYWGGTAIQAGSGIRDLSLRANPAPPDYNCSGMLGVKAMVDGAVIERVDVLGPRLPEESAVPIPSAEVERGFLAAVTIEGADVRFQHSRVRHAGSITLRRGGSPLLDDISLQNGFLFISGDARVQNCELVVRLLSAYDSTIYGIPVISIAGGSPTFGPGNYCGLAGRPTVDCYGGSTPTIINNEFVGHGGPVIGISDGAWARVVGNFMGARFARSIVHVESDAVPFSVFENNILYGSWTQSRIEAPVDFGGGPSGSTGGNHFGPIGRFSAERPELVFDIPGGGDVHAADNYWRDGRPDAQMHIEAPTRVITSRPRVDPLTPEDGLDRFIAAIDAHES